jgi:alpha-tubulin suppressor-like RCC1 family protein
MAPYQPTTNFVDSNGTDLGSKLITKDYLISVYPQIANQLITPELWTWGYGGFGQLGNSSNTISQSVPVTTTAGGSNWKQVTCGYFHTAAVKNDGTLWTWGRNGNGQLGNGTTSDTSTPVQVGSATSWRQVSCGYYYTMAVKTDGTLWTWGSAQYGALGNNASSGNVTTPTQIGSSTSWKYVNASFEFFNSSAIKNDGTLWTWGYNNYGNLGLNDTNQRSTPTQVGSATTWKQIAMGTKQTTAIKTDGTLWTWGDNGYGQLGLGDTTSRSTPTQVGSATNWKQCASGYRFCSAIKIDGTLWTWGGYYTGSLGNPAYSTNQSTPVTTYGGGTNWKQVACGRYTGAAIKTDGTLWTWGDGINGELGNGQTNVFISSPIQTTLGGNSWKQVACGTFTTAAIRTGDDLQGL